MRRLMLIVCAACLTLTASGASARFGNPIKKAKEKLEKAVAPNAEPAPAGGEVVFDNVVVELTNARVETIIATFEKAKAAGAGRGALVAQLDQKNQERDKLMEKDGDAMNALRNKRDDLNACYGAGYQEVTNRKMEEYKTRALSDPKLLAKYTKIAQENNAAIARGDSAAAARANSAILEEMLPSPEDSARVRQSCGAYPPKSAAETRLEALDKEIASLNEQIRQIDQKVAKAQAKDSGMTDQQWSVALERVQAYLDATKSTSNASRGRKSKTGDQTANGGGNQATVTVKSRAGYTNAEVEVLEKHREQLRAALG